jgi:hypothetical protein
MTATQTKTHSMTIAEAQLDMRTAYIGGATGMLSSALVWMTAGFVALYMSSQQAVWALLIGGVFIHPISILFTKVLKRSGKHNKNNPLASLAMASTIWMILMLVLAYVVSLYRMDLFFPAVLFIIGGRFLTFSTLYGTRTYSICGGTLILAGYLLATNNASPVISAFTGSAIEAIFAVAIFITTANKQA